VPGVVDGPAESGAGPVAAGLVEPPPRRADPRDLPADAGRRAAPTRPPRHWTPQAAEPTPAL